jgi:hypothetical protein
MKLWFPAFVAVTVLVFALMIPFGVPAAPPAHNGPPAAHAAPPAAAAAANALPEPHPEIREAIEALRGARAHLEHATHDFGGHRVDALHATDEAIRQLQICLKYDRD